MNYNYHELAEVVNKFYTNDELVRMKLQELTKKHNNRAKAKELMNIRIEFKHTHMSGKEQLDNILKKAYLFEFKIISKEKVHLNEIIELNKLICLLDNKIIKLSNEDITNPIIEKKKNERKILQSEYDNLIDLQPKDDHLNLNSIAMKILKILEKDDEESRKIHNVIKFKVCGTTVADDLAIRRANLKYLSGDTRNDEEKKIEQIENNIKSRDRGNMRSSYSTNKFSVGYVLPHLRPKKHNGAFSTEDLTEIKSDVEEYPVLCSSTKSQNTSTWGLKKSFVDLLKNNITEEVVLEIVSEIPQTLSFSSTIEIVKDSVCENDTKQNKQKIKTIEVEDWTIND